MPDGFEVAADIRPVADLIAALRLGNEEASRIERLQRRHTKCRAATAQYAEQLAQLYEDIARSGHDADWLVQAATIVRRREETEREKLRPDIEALKQKLAEQRGDNAATRPLIEESIAIAETWLSLPADLHEKLLILAANRRLAASKIRHARPVAGEVDRTALTYEIIGRFPKILAELAK